MLQLGDLAHLLNLPPVNAEQELRLLSLYAADIKEKEPAEDEAEELPPLDLAPAPMPSMAAPPIMGKFPVGSRVRDMLSGQEGEVAQGPDGNYGDVVFVKNDADGLVHPMDSKFLESLAVGAIMPTAPIIPPVGAGEPAMPGNELEPAMLPEAEMASAEDAEMAKAAESPTEPKAKKKFTTTTIKGYKPSKRSVKAGKLEALRVSIVPSKAEPGKFDLIDMDSAGDKLETFDSADAAKDYAKAQSWTVKASSAAAVQASFDLVSSPKDDRKIEYKALLAKLKAAQDPTHADALDVIGYVPEGWDLMVARLMKDGILLKSKKASFDVGELIRNGLTASEIRFVLGRKGVPMYALDTAFTKIKADTMNKPNIPMPVTPPSPGMNWVWNATTKKWYMQQTQP